MKASVAVTQRNGRLAVEVSDDGVGGADLDRGTGLRGLADRLVALDGRLEIDSKPPHGTIVRAILPGPQHAQVRGLGATACAPNE